MDESRMRGLSAPAERFIQAVSDMESALMGLQGREGVAYYRDLVQVLDSRLPHVYSAYDGYVAAALAADGKEVACRRGCSACCSHFVDSVEPFEIAAIHLRIRHSERYANVLLAAHRRASLFDQLRREEGRNHAPEEAEDRALHRYFLRGAPCPFLGVGGVCGIYDSRPMSCRMFFSAASPRFCAGAAIASPWNGNFQVELPEEAERALARCSAMLAHLDFPEGLFPGLLAANERFGAFDSAG